MLKYIVSWTYSNIGLQFLYIPYNSVYNTKPTLSSNIAHTHTISIRLYVELLSQLSNLQRSSFEEYVPKTISTDCNFLLRGST